MRRATPILGLFATIRALG